MKPIRSLIPIVLIASLAAANPAQAETRWSLCRSRPDQPTAAALDRRLERARCEPPIDLQSQHVPVAGGDEGDIQAQRNDALAGPERPVQLRPPLRVIRCLWGRCTVHRPIGTHVAPPASELLCRQEREMTARPVAIGTTMRWRWRVRVLPQGDQRYIRLARRRLRRRDAVRRWARPTEAEHPRPICPTPRRDRGRIPDDGDRPMASMVAALVTVSAYDLAQGSLPSSRPIASSTSG